MESLLADLVAVLALDAAAIVLPVFAGLLALKKLYSNEKAAKYAFLCGINESPYLRERLYEP